MGMVHLLQSHIEEAIVWLEKARSASPEKPYKHLHLAAAYALSGAPSTAAIASRASAPCRTSALDQRFCRLGL